MTHKVKYCKWGLANYYEDYIEISSDLKYNKSLRDYVIRHELGHQKSFDLKHEFDFNPKVFTLGLFILKHPRTWIDLLPIQYKNKKILYDINLSLLYLLIIGLSIILLKIY